MATIVHRRVVRRVAPGGGELDGAGVDPMLEPRAPDAGLQAAAQQLTLVGWLSLAGALAFLIFRLRYLLDGGAFFESRVQTDMIAIVRALSGAAAIALPAALELGGGGARRAVTWLMRGAVLVAIGEVVRLVIVELRDILFTAAGPEVDRLDYSQPLSLAFAIAVYAPAILLIAGIWALSDGLADAGARPHRRVLSIGAAAAVALSATQYLPYLEPGFDGGVFDPRTGSGVFNIASVLVSLVLIALTTVFGIRLVAGARALHPRRAWLIAGAAGVCQLAAILGSVINLSPELASGPLAILVFVADGAVWMLLAAAFALGLGRGGTRLEGPRRLVARWVRYPAS